MKVTLTTVQMYCRDDHSMIVTTQYDVDHKQNTNAQQMMLYSFQVYKKIICIMLEKWWLVGAKTICTN